MIGLADNVPALGGSLSGSATGSLADVDAIALSTSNTYTDSAVNTAVNAAITQGNQNWLEVQTTLNALLAALVTSGAMDS